MSNQPRKPAAFRVEPQGERQAKKPEAGRTNAGAAKSAARKPRAIEAEAAVVAVPPAEDPFASSEIAALEPPPAPPPRRRRRWHLGGILATALGILVSLGIGLWTDRLIRDLFDRADWAGWFALGVAGVAAAALLLILMRELLALYRLGSAARLQTAAAEAIAANDSRQARHVVDQVAALFSSMPETARGRAHLEELRDDIIDGADLVGLAETEILAPLDARARVLVLDAAKRVSVVTAISPRAVVDLAYVVIEAGRLIRRLAELYGGRPGTLGFFRLTRNVLSHLAVTGSIAVGDSLVQQIIGHGLAARLSARLGEGVVNGLMTARIGIAAIETARPLPFHKVRRPGMGDFLSDLTTFWSKRQAGKD